MAACCAGVGELVTAGFAATGLAATLLEVPFPLA